jgi:hypothetical protein
MMKKITFLFFVLTASLLSNFTLAQVERSQLTTSIENREPVDNLGNTVSGQNDQIARVYFFTQIANLAGQQIIHRWIYQGDEKAAVTLNIGADSWRTYSSKQIPSYWQGDWQVQVWNGDLQLTSHDFVVSFSE